MLIAPPARATYSIVAADATAREVGGAVTSCVAPQSVELVYRAAPGHGAIHAQAAANTAGRDRGVALLAAGTAPADVIAEITQSSFDTRFQTRQYGVVDLSGRAAGFTGSSAQQYREDRQGSLGSYVYSIQGNILTSARVLDQAEAAFKASGCDLAERLMLALEAGAQNGEGDSRCTTARGIPSDAASLDVDREGQAAGSYLHLTFTSTNALHENPIVPLRASFNRWRQAHPCPVVNTPGGGTGGAGGSSGGSDKGGSGGASGGVDSVGGSPKGGSGGSGGSANGATGGSGGSPNGGSGGSGDGASGGLDSVGGGPKGGIGSTGGGSSGGGFAGGSAGASAGMGPTASTGNNGCGCRVHRRTTPWSLLVGALAGSWLIRRRIAKRGSNSKPNL